MVNSRCSHDHKYLWGEVIFFPDWNSDQNSLRFPNQSDFTDKQRPVHDTKFILNLVCVFLSWGPSIKDVGISLAVFDTPLPHVGILTLIYLTYTYLLISCNIGIWDPPCTPLRYSDVFYGWPPGVMWPKLCEALCDVYWINFRVFLHKRSFCIFRNEEAFFISWYLFIFILFLISHSLTYAHALWAVGAGSLENLMCSKMSTAFLFQMISNLF